MPRKSRENVGIRAYILQHVRQHPTDMASVAAKHFGVTRVTINRYLRKLVEENLITATGETKARRYTLQTILFQVFQFDLSPAPEEHVIWRERIAPLLEGVPDNVLYICNYGTTEMINNVIDHSEGSQLRIRVEATAADVTITVRDNGVGIFDKIRRDLSLADPRHALLELSKGKLTTDPTKHTGEGVFFTSRMFDDFSIYSGELFYRREAEEDDDWLIEVADRSERLEGTSVTLRISVSATRTAEEVFKRFENDDRGFSKTHVPVRLARYGDEQLVSRSQARRVLARFNRFSEVILDFNGVPKIGQAFADEIFRVFKNEHPEIRIIAVRTSRQVREMIDRAARSHDNEVANRPASPGG